MIAVILVLLLVGVACYLIPMDERIKTAIIVLALVFAVIYLLRLAGVAIPSLNL